MAYSEKTTKIVKTTVLYLSFFTLGLCAAIPGPTLLDLQQITNTDMNEVGYLFLSRSGSYLLGSLLGGIIFDLIQKKQLGLMFCNLFMSISTLATPWTRSIESLVGVVAVSGLAMGALDIGANVLCLNIWGKESAPYFHALHFLFGLGAFVAPMIAEPFLSKECVQDVNDLPTSNESLLNSSISNFSFVINASNASCQLDSIPPITYSYSIIGGFSLFVTLLFVMSSVVLPSEKKHRKDASEKEKQKDSIIFIVAFALLAQFILSLYCGIEIGYGQLLLTYAVKSELKLSKSVGSYITAFYWGTFTFSRGISIFLSKKFHPYKLVFGDIMLITVGLVLLATVARWHVEMFWFGTFVLALGLASFYPAMVSLVDRFIKVSNKIASLFVISGCLGEMIIPVTASQFIEYYPVALIYLFLGCTIVKLFGMFVVVGMTRNKVDRYLIDSHANCHLPVETESKM